jgi:methionine sulfoxide reductase heme-binding subunit
VIRAIPIPNRPRAARRRRSWLVPAIWVGSLFPLALLGWRARAGGLGANPIAEALNQLGLLALVLLTLSLAMTPVRILTGSTAAIEARKTLGNFGFFYAACHLLTYAGLDQGFDLRAIGRDIVQRPFITVGMLAFVLLIPLAVTSTPAMLKRLGARRWKRLHRLAYVAAPLGCVHFVLRVKKDLSEPLAYGVVIAVLLAIRVVDHLRKKRAAAAAASSRLEA